MKKVWLALWFLGAIHVHAQVYQPMAVLKQTVTFGGGGGFSGGGAGGVGGGRNTGGATGGNNTGNNTGNNSRQGRAHGYCLDYFSTSPNSMTSFSRMATNPTVTIQFDSGRPEVMPLSQASSFFTMIGGSDEVERDGDDQNHDNVVLVQQPGLDRNITQVTFHAPAVAIPEGYDGFSDEKLIRKLESIEEDTAYIQERQEKIWKHDIRELHDHLLRTDEEYRRECEVAAERINAINALNTEADLTLPEKPIRFQKSVEGGFETYLNPDVKDKKIHLDYIKLTDGGSATLFRTTAGEIILMDVGKSRSDAIQIMNILRRYYNTQTVRINISHPDGDHTGGLKHLLDSGFLIPEIILPIARNHPETKLKIAKMTQLLLTKGYQKTEGNGVVRFLLRGHTVTEQTDMPEVQDENGDLFPMESRIIKIDSQVQVHTFQFTKPRTTNDHSIMTKISYNNIWQLNLGDAGKPAIQALLDRDEMIRYEVEITSSVIDRYDLSFQQIATMGIDDYIMDGLITLYPYTSHTSGHRIDATAILKSIAHNLILSIQEQERLRKQLKELIANSLVSDVLQWPHHCWLLDVSIPSNKAFYDRMLDQIDPQLIILSVPPGNAGQRCDNVKAYVAGYCKRKGKNIAVKLLESSPNSIRIIAMLFEPSQLVEGNTHEVSIKD